MYIISLFQMERFCKASGRYWYRRANTRKRNCDLTSGHRGCIERYTSEVLVDILHIIRQFLLLLISSFLAPQVRSIILIPASVPFFISNSPPLLTQHAPVVLQSRHAAQEIHKFIRHPGRTTDVGHCPVPRLHVIAERGEQVVMRNATREMSDFRRIYCR